MIQRAVSGTSYFNPRPPRGGRLGMAAITDNYTDFNPRPPRGGRQHTANHFVSLGAKFQSTPPARGATRTYSRLLASIIFQSTPPARGATTGKKGEDGKDIYISIHAPREGGDRSASH